MIFLHKVVKKRCSTLRLWGGASYPGVKSDEQRWVANAPWWTRGDRDGKERIANKVTVGTGQHPDHLSSCGCARNGLNGILFTEG